MLTKSRPRRMHLAWFLVAIATAIPAAAQTSPAAAHTSSVARASVPAQPRIDNFGRINANYYRGAQPNGRDYRALSALGVKTIINLTSDDASADEASLSEEAGMKYVQIPMTTHEPPTAAQLSQFLAIVNDPANQPVYVHCVGGRHRTGVMTAAYRMTSNGWTGTQAFREMKQYKFGSEMLHPEFKAFVYGYRADNAQEPAIAASTKVESDGDAAAQQKR